MKQAAQRVLQRAGFQLHRVNPPQEPAIPNGGVPVDGLRSYLAEVPGMISTERGVAHYLMAYSQSIRGDIIEVGSWQGRNTCFLAAACRDSNNGRVHAIDHFRGNPGKEHFYVVGDEDLSDLEANFLRNVAGHGLSDWVTLHAADAETVSIEDPVRLLFIDGDHRFEGVRRDLARFGPLVPRGGLVIFDDYTAEFPGVVDAAQEWLTQVEPVEPIQWRGSLIVRLAL